MRKLDQPLFVARGMRGKWPRVYGVIASMVLLLVAIALDMFSFTPSRASAMLASDSFKRTVSNGWGTANLGGSWMVLDNTANWSVKPGVGSINVAANGQERGILGSISARDVDLNARIVLPRCTSSGTNCDAYIMGRFTGGTSPTYYRIGLIQGLGQSTVLLRSQSSDGRNLTSDLDTGIAAANTVVVNLRVEFQGINPTTIRARAWLKGATEPSTWLLNVTDSTSAEQVAGQFGVRARNEDTAGHVFKFNSFHVTALRGGSPTPTPSATTPTPTGTPITGTAASDSFQRGLASGWGNADTGGWWSVVGSPWNWSVAPGAGSVNVGAGSMERAYLSTFTTQDVDLVEKVVLPRCTGGGTNCDAFVLGRYAPAYNPTYYRVGAVQGAGRSDIFLRAQRDNGTSLGSDIDTGLPAANGAVVWLHVQFQGVNPTTIRARAWLQGTSEPSNWPLTTTDSNGAEQIAGMAGVQWSNEDTGSSHTFQAESFQASGTAFPVSVAPNPSGSTTAHWLYVVDDGEVYAYGIDLAIMLW